MTISAQIPDRPLPQPPDVDHPTHGMDANHPFVVDAYDLVDHRTRERAIPEAGAPAGRYLALETTARLA